MLAEWLWLLSDEENGETGEEEEEKEETDETDEEEVNEEEENGRTETETGTEGARVFSLRFSS